jgi:diguanylate cyclase (GGDEF)-like protein
VASLVVLAPFAAYPLPHFPAFDPADNAWTILCALITTLLLLGEVGVARSGAVLALSAGYMLMAVAAILQFLTNAANFSNLGLAGDHPTTTHVMILIRGAVAPVSIMVYVALTRAPTRRDGAATGRRSWTQTQISVVLGLAMVLVLGWGALPLIVMLAQALWRLVSNAPLGAGLIFRAFDQLIAILDIAAMGALIRQGFKSRFDLWLFVMLLASFCQVILSGLLSAGSFDLGWYGGMAFGAAASGTLMVALLFESANHFEQLAEMHAALLASNRSLEHLSLHDSLTGLANRRHFDSYLSRQVTLMRRHRRPLALVLCDLDNFKAFNDLHGHQAGDDCLARIAVALQACCRRPADMAARYGGEEFALVLPETDLAGATRIAEAAREAVSRLKLDHPKGNSTPHMTVSGGVAVLDGHGEGSLDALVAAADAALFEAKRQGRDCIVVSKRQLAAV